MKLVILSQDPRLHSTRRLLQAARARGHSVQVVEPMRCRIRIACGALALDYAGRALGKVDALIPRVGASAPRHALAVVRQFELMGVPVGNTADAIACARDKLRCHQLLAAQGLDLPLTEAGEEAGHAAAGLAPPLVVKLNEGSQGVGVMLAESMPAARSLVDALQGLRAEFFLQAHVSDAQDLRCLVIGDRVVAAMRRQPRSDDFRANLHCGGAADPVVLDAQEERVAIRAARIVGLRVAGVDLLRTAQGPLVLEVNASPGLQGIEAVTGVDVAGAIIEDVVQRAVATA